MGKAWAGRSIHEITKRDVVELVWAIEQRGAPVAANKALKSVKTFLRWCLRATPQVVPDAKRPMIARGTWLTLTLLTSCLSPHSTDMLSI